MKPDPFNHKECVEYLFPTEIDNRTVALHTKNALHTFYITRREKCVSITTNHKAYFNKKEVAELGEFFTLLSQYMPD